MVTWLYEVLLPTVLLDKVLFYSFQLVLILLRKNWGPGSGSGSACGLRSFYRLDSWEHLIKCSLPLETSSSCGPSDTTLALNFVFTTHTMSQCPLLAPCPLSGLSIQDHPSTLFWAPRFLCHKLDVLTQSWLCPVHVLITRKLYLQPWQRHWATNSHYHCKIFKYVPILFLSWIIIAAFPILPQPSRCGSETEKNFYILQYPEIQ